MNFIQNANPSLQAVLMPSTRRFDKFPEHDRTRLCSSLWGEVADKPLESLTTRTIAGWDTDGDPLVIHGDGSISDPRKEGLEVVGLFDSKQREVLPAIPEIGSGRLPYLDFVAGLKSYCRKMVYQNCRREPEAYPVSDRRPTIDKICGLGASEVRTIFTLIDDLDEGAVFTERAPFNWHPFSIFRPASTEAVGDALILAMFDGLIADHGTNENGSRLYRKVLPSGVLISSWRRNLKANGEAEA